MIGTAATEARAREAFRTAWIEVKSQLPRAPEGVDEECLLERLTHELIGLVEGRRSQPVRELAPTIERMLTDLQFIDDNGDSVIDGEQHQDMLERQVKVALDVLESLRLEIASEHETATAGESSQYVG